MFENINWNWQSIGVAVIFLFSAMIAGGTQIQIKDALAFGKIQEAGSGCANSLLGFFKWASVVMAGVSLVTMLMGYPFNKISWWIVAGWLLFIMSRGNGVVQATSGAAKRIQSFAPREWQWVLIEKIKTNPELKRELAEVMWLDEFLMSAIQANPSREFPEMNQAWQLCIRIARELGIPDQEGADWLSHNATPIGKQLGILPTKPQPI